MATIAVAALALLARGSMRIASATTAKTAEQALREHFPLETVLRSELLREDGKQWIYLVPGEDEDDAVVVECEAQGCEVTRVDPLHR